MTREPMIPSVEAFVAQARALFEQKLSDRERWEKMRVLFEVVLLDPELNAHSNTWPSGTPEQAGLFAARNLLFYEDPDYGFAINALVKDPDNTFATIHDHGKSWTLYGILDGRETVRRYDRLDGETETPVVADLKETSAIEVAAGDVDFVPPWQVHGEFKITERVVGLIVRSQRSGTFPQNRYFPETGKVEQYMGLIQVPYHLGYPVGGAQVAGAEAAAAS